MIVLGVSKSSNARSVLVRWIGAAVTAVISLSATAAAAGAFTTTHLSRPKPAAVPLLGFPTIGTKPKSNTARRAFLSADFFQNVGNSLLVGLDLTIPPPAPLPINEGVDTPILVGLVGIGVILVGAVTAGSVMSNTVGMERMDSSTSSTPPTPAPESAPPAAMDVSIPSDDDKNEDDSATAATTQSDNENDPSGEAAVASQVIETSNEEQAVAEGIDEPPTPEKTVAPDVVDVSIPYDAAARLAYEDALKTGNAEEGDVGYAKFKVEYEAAAVALVVAKKKARDST